MTVSATLAILWILGASAPVGSAPKAESKASSKDESTKAEFAPPRIETFGTIRGLTQSRDLAPKVTLSRIQTVAHAYGLGSLSDLRGEVTFLDGVAWLAYPPARAGEAPRVSSSAQSDETAAFLAVSHVEPPQWKAIGLPDTVTADNLEATIQKMLPPAQQKKGSPRMFPFRVEGHFQSVALAIVDGRLLPANARGEAAFDKANVLLGLNDVDGTLVGFYSAKEGAAFDHAHKRAHVHAVIPKNQATGHARSFVLAPGSTLLMP